MDERIRKLDPEDSLEQEEAREYVLMVMEELRTKYGLDKEGAEERMKSSGFLSGFEEDPYYYFRYAAEDTAELIFKGK